MNRGFIQLIIIIVLSVIILSLLGISIQSFVNNTTLHQNFTYLFAWIAWLWQTYIAHYFWAALNTLRGKF